MQYSTVNATVPVDSDDVLVVDAYSSVTTSIGVVVRYLDEAFRIKLLRSQSPLVVTGGNPNHVAIPLSLSKGQLIGVTIYSFDRSGNTLPSRGLCFATAQLFKGGNTNNQLSLQLVANYVTDFNAASFPESPMISPGDGSGALASSVLGTLVGANIIYTVPARSTWQLRSIVAHYQSDATAGDRLLTLQITSGGAAVVNFRTIPQPIPPNTDIYLQWGDFIDGADPTGTDAGGNPIDTYLARFFLPLLKSSDTVIFIPTGAGATDQIDTFLTVETRVAI